MVIKINKDKRQVITSGTVPESLGFFFYIILGSICN